jgi:hypothetical protein
MADSATAFIAAGVFDAADPPDDEFVFGLDRILDGLGALIEGLRVLALRPEPRSAQA